MRVITRTLLIVLIWQHVCGRVTVPIVKYNGCMHDGNGNFDINCTTSQRIYMLNAVLGRSAEMCQDEARCCPSSSDCTGDAEADHLQHLRNQCDGQQHCQVAVVKHLCNGHLTDYETVTFVCTAVTGKTTAPTIKATTTTHISTTAIKSTATAEASTIKATTTTRFSSTAVKSTTTEEASTIKAMTTTHISTTARKSTATTTAVHVASTAQNVADHSSGGSPASSSAEVLANTDTVWITTSRAIDSTSSMASGGSPSADVSSTTDVSRKDANVHSNKFTNTTLLLIVVPCVVAIVAIILFIIYRTTRRTKSHLRMDKPPRTTSLYDTIPIDN